MDDDFTDPEKFIEQSKRQIEVFSKMDHTSKKKFLRDLEIESVRLVLKDLDIETSLLVNEKE